MVKHVVMWRLKDRTEGGSKKENASTVKQMFEDLNGKIPGMIKLEVGIDYAMSDASSCIVLYSEFVDEEALDGYQFPLFFDRDLELLGSLGTRLHAPSCRRR